MDEELQTWCERAQALGAADATPIAPVQVITAEWVRRKCQFGCDGFGQCRTCPPHSPTPGQTRSMLDEYRRALLLTTGPSREYDDSDRRHESLRAASADLERELFLAGYYKAFSISCGPCEVCETCDMDAPCVDPEHARPSMEASGIDVFATVRNVDWEIDVVRDKQDTYRFFALVLVD